MIQIGKFKFDSKHIAALVLFILGSFGSNVLPAGSLAKYTELLAPWLQVASMILALVANSIMVKDAPPSKPAGYASLSALLGVITVAMGVALACCLHEQAQHVESITEDEAKAITAYMDKLEHCKNVGREAGTYAAYEDCCLEGGIR